MRYIPLEIYTPLKKYFVGDVSFILVQSDNYRLGILPRHERMISTIKISELVLTFPGGKKVSYAVGGGMINVKKDKTIIIVDSIENKDEIDIDRANRSKERAQNRLFSKDKNIDIKRAQLSLERALNRIKVASR